MPSLPQSAIQEGFCFSLAASFIYNTLKAPDDFGRSCFQQYLPFVNCELVCKRVYESNTFQRLSILKVLTENHRNLVEPGTRPNLRIVIGELMIPYTAGSFQNNLRGEGNYWKGALPVLYLLQHLIGWQLHFCGCHAKKISQALHT